MSYAKMDHAGWVQDNNRARNSMLSKGRKSASNLWPETLSPFQATVMDILGMVGGGIYNAPINWDKVRWDVGGGMFVPYADNRMATFDFHDLTSLVFLCHEARVRCQISAKAHGHFELGFWQRAAEGGMARRHPSLDEAVEAFRGYLPGDHRILYRASAADQAVGSE